MRRPVHVFTVMLGVFAAFGAAVWLVDPPPLAAFVTGWVAGLLASSLAITLVERD